MYDYLFPPDFWIKMTIWLVGIIVSIALFNAIMRKVLNVERRKFFSYNFVNDFHKKGEWILRISFIIIYIVIAANDAINPFFFYAIFAFAILLSGFRAIVEKKYAKNSKDYIFTLSELGFAMVIIFVLTLKVFPEVF
ncbi:MAG: DUF4181 domain-containing protein [Paenisporosarcina sp.]